MNNYVVNTLDPIVSPVTSDELCDWVRGDCCDPIYSPLLRMATSEVIEFLKLDLIERNWVLTYQDWPYHGYYSCRDLSKSNSKYESRIELPYTNLISVDQVQINNEVSTDYDILQTKPVELCFDYISINNECDTQALIVNYKAGYGTIDDVPQIIKDGIIMVGGYLYTNRGCTAQEAFKNSGAMSLLQPFRVAGGVVI